MSAIYSLVENKWIGHLASTAARSLQNNTNRNRSSVFQFGPQTETSLPQAPTVEAISRWRSLRRSSIPVPTEWLENQLEALAQSSDNRPSYEHIDHTSVANEGEAEGSEVTDDIPEDVVENLSDSFETDSMNSMLHINVNQRYLNEFDEIECLGRGGFGVVHRVRNRIDHMEYAVKRVELKEMSEEELEVALSETRVMASLPPHQNIVRYFSSWLESTNIIRDSSSDAASLFDVDSTQSASHSSSSSLETGHALYIQMGLCGQGVTLAQYLRSRSPSGKGLLGEAENHIFRQIVDAIHHMHHHGFEHLDLSPRNVFQYAPNKWCVGDFSFTSKFGIHTQQEVGTHLYAAPEVSGGKPSAILSGAADIFSLGVVLAEMCMEFSTAMERVVELEKVRKSRCVEGMKSSKLSKLIDSMLSHNPDDRVSIDQVKTHLLHGQVAVEMQVSQARIYLKQLSGTLNSLEETETLGEELAQWKALVSDPRFSKLMSLQ